MNRSSQVLNFRHTENKHASAASINSARAPCNNRFDDFPSESRVPTVLICNLEAACESTLVLQGPLLPFITIPLGDCELPASSAILVTKLLDDPDAMLISFPGLDLSWPILREGMVGGKFRDMACKNTLEILTSPLTLPIAAITISPVNPETSEAKSGQRFEAFETYPKKSLKNDAIESIPRDCGQKDGLKEEKIER
nr:hypothetical protein Iba_chr07bCG0050 [Ipomoea batatas]GMD77074.1 hypothetical protein Iba_chr13bCG16360 [Ipomoea batatas]GME09883.1 hypothetical protein Iba_scaffold9175CG0360 [Ipomoea batatas]GME14183.1 hypothetical protein Iba_scaffold15021.1CG0020 [Ipomoea batatas]